MNRPKAYVKELGVCDVILIDWEMEHALIYDEVTDTDPEYQFDELEFIWPTGLKDKNGQEIYEGDILHEKYRWLVIYRVGCFYAKSKVDTSRNRNPLLWRLKNDRVKARDELEVIGNKFENPELLDND